MTEAAASIGDDGREATSTPPPRGGRGPTAGRGHPAREHDEHVRDDVSLLVRHPVRQLVVAGEPAAVDIGHESVVAEADGHEAHARRQYGPRKTYHGDGRMPTGPVRISTTAAVAGVRWRGRQSEDSGRTEGFTNLRS